MAVAQSDLHHGGGERVSVGGIVAGTPLVEDCATSVIAAGVLVSGMAYPLIGQAEHLLRESRLERLYRPIKVRFFLTPPGETDPGPIPACRRRFPTRLAGARNFRVNVGQVAGRTANG
jgi:hypothetical protein